MSRVWLLSAAVVGLGVFVLAVTVVRQGGQTHAGGPQDGVVCTADAMQCPDGSWVGRSGPKCQFVCPTTATTSAPDQGILPYHSGIEGTVTLSPTCPVEHNPPMPGCEPKAYQYALVAIFSAADLVHAKVLTKTDANGHFVASLPPGDYMVGAGDSNLPRCTQVSATVGPTSYTQVTVSCDTGIR